MSGEITGSEEDVLLVLSKEEHAYLLKLLLDYGAYAPPDRIRVPLVSKLAKPYGIEDVELQDARSALSRILGRKKSDGESRG